MRQPPPSTARRRRPLGQAFLEVVLAAPALVVLLTGSAQVGTIAYAEVQVDTAAREAARIGAESANTSLSTPASQPNHTYTCTSSDPTVETNPICVAAYASAGLLDKSQMTVVITVPVTLSRLPGDIVYVGNPQAPCNGSQAKVSGQVTYNGSPVSNSWKVLVSSDGSPGNGQYVVNGQYSPLCLPPGTQTLSAVATQSPDGCLYSAVFSNQVLNNNTQYTYNFALLQSNCPTTTTTSTTTTSSTTTTTTSVGVTSISGSATAPPPVTCPSGQQVQYPAYFSVTVSYRVAIFVPLVSQWLADPPPASGSRRTVSSTVTEQVQPCGIPQASGGGGT